MAYPQTDYSACCGIANATPGDDDAGSGAGNQPDDGILSQSFPTTVGAKYIVSFEYGAVDYSLPQSMSVSIVSGANTLNAAISAIGTMDFATLFSPYSYTFTADAATTTLTFADTSTITDDVDGLLGEVSAVSLNQIPEPASFALLGLGFASVGARRRTIPRCPKHDAKDAGSIALSGNRLCVQVEAAWSAPCSDTSSLSSATAKSPAD